MGRIPGWRRRPGNPHLSKEALGAERRSQFWVQDLDRNCLGRAEVAGQVDGGHTASSELTLERVAVPESVG